MWLHILIVSLVHQKMLQQKHSNAYLKYEVQLKYDSNFMSKKRKIHNFHSTTFLSNNFIKIILCYIPFFYIKAKLHVCGMCQSVDLLFILN